MCFLETSKPSVRYRKRQGNSCPQDSQEHRARQDGEFRTALSLDGTPVYQFTGLEKGGSAGKPTRANQLVCERLEETHERQTHYFLRVGPEADLERAIRSSWNTGQRHKKTTAPDGILKGTGDKQRGSIAIPNLSEENDIEDIEISICRKKGEGDTLKDLMKTKGVQKIREALACYLHSLRTEFTQGMVLSTQSRKKTSEFAKQGLCGHTVVDTVGVRIPTCKLILKDTFVSSAAELYKAFTSQEESRKFSGTESVAEAQKGGKFSLYNREVTGEFLELKENEQIDMRWRCRNWTAEHYASVTVKLLDVSGQAQVQVECKNIPAAEEQSTRLCWQRTYFDPLKRLLSHCAEMPTE
ncbi:activator of 90 kDa heat shock protein ATPase homolog 2 [Lepisosteus oculatus]|uniref:activator of 90 kDa heat shock protein ATPase homolog 2 n=1 Tax=Lepisosteus oculatus TaxID=7918 RepID=UPI0035F52C1F